MKIETSLQASIEKLTELIEGEAEVRNIQFQKIIESIQRLENMIGGVPITGADELYLEAEKLAIAAKRASTSFLQRKLGVGYSRAAKLIDLLEENKVVGKPDSKNVRHVLPK